MATHSPAPLDPLLVVILGPTASGKSALGIALAEQFSGEIVSCDSVAVYRHFEIGTAKPSRDDRARVPHHLIDVAEPGEAFTAGEYARQARAALHEIAERGHLPIVVGGTGLYLRALLDGLFPGPQRSDELARTPARARGRAGLGVSPSPVAAARSPIRRARSIPTTRPSSSAPSKSAWHPRGPMSELWQQRDAIRCAASAFCALD